MVEWRGKTVPQPIIATIRTSVRPALLRLRRLYLVKVWGMKIGKGTQISFTAKLDKTNPTGIKIGDHSIVTFGATLLTHDALHNRHGDVVIGNNCFIGARSIILPGVEIGDNSIIGAGAVVVKSVPPHSLVAGNPGQVVKSELQTGAYGEYEPASKQRPEAKSINGR
jgi:acetyltransferase-like isoleucine patch superfamily enzyme